jgi:hypothetical protein
MPRTGPLGNRAWWTTSVSNRAGAACKAALHTCASPLEPACGLEPDPPLYECGAPPVVLRWDGAAGETQLATSRLQGGRTTCGASSAWCPRRESNARWTASQTAASTDWATWDQLGAEDSNLHERVQSPSGCRVTSAPIVLAGHARGRSARGERRPRGPIDRRIIAQIPAPRAVTGTRTPPDSLEGCRSTC